jgi:hypothetical protein
MSSLLSSLARSLSGDTSRSYSATGSSSLKSLPSFNDFNSMTADHTGWRASPRPNSLPIPLLA